MEQLAFACLLSPTGENRLEVLFEDATQEELVRWMSQALVVVFNGGEEPDEQPRVSD